MGGQLATLVARRRAEFGLTMRDLAAKIGVSSAYIAHLEHGRIDTPSPQVLAGLARELQVSEEALLHAIGYLQQDRPSVAAIRPVRSLSQLVRQAREARGMTQAQVDESVGMSIGYTGMVESGRITRPRPETLRKLEHVLGIPRQDVLVATGELDAPSEDASVVLQRIAAMPHRDQRLEAWALLGDPLRAAIMTLMQDILLAAAQNVWLQAPPRDATLVDVCEHEAA